MAENRSNDGSPEVSSWSSAYERLVGGRHDDLDVSELETLAVAAFLHGDDDRADEAWSRAYERFLDGRQPGDAARCAFWLGLTLMLRGRMAHASGWLERAHETIEHEPPCAANGLLMIPAVLGALDAGDTDMASELAAEALEIGRRYGDADVAALATLAHGQALIAGGDIDAGLAKLDAAMLAVEANSIGPISSGVVYCAVILECMSVFDYARASEWTSALDGWCRSQPGLVPFRGQCLVHQSQLLQASGEWDEATAAVELAIERLAAPPHPALGFAHYQQAEMHRIVGSHDAAADSYTRAIRAGHPPNPGLALLQLQRGAPELAAATIRRALDDAVLASRRPALLAAAVEIFRAVGDGATAATSADELDELAASSPSAALQAMARTARGAVKLDGGDPPAALGELRAAMTAWRKLRMPYEAAQVGVLVGQAYAAMDDSSLAAAEFDDAGRAFAELGAEFDVAATRSIARSIDGEPDSGPLTARELEVLAHAAAGRTSAEIATELSISPHTVRRHLENVYAKLGVSGRAAAVAHAYQHGLL